VRHHTLDFNRSYLLRGVKLGGTFVTHNARRPAIRGPAQDTGNLIGRGLAATVDTRTVNGLALGNDRHTGEEFRHVLSVTGKRMAGNFERGNFLGTITIMTP
jgi:hypothetical protein